MKTLIKIKNKTYKWILHDDYEKWRKKFKVKKAKS